MAFETTTGRQEVKDYGPFSLPVTLRISDGSGKPLVAKDAIKAWAPEDKALSENWFIDIGAQYQN